MFTSGVLGEIFGRVFVFFFFFAWDGGETVLGSCPGFWAKVLAGFVRVLAGFGRVLAGCGCKFWFLLP